MSRRAVRVTTAVLALRICPVGQVEESRPDSAFRCHKHWMREGGISTPLVAHWPSGIKARGEVRRQVGHVVDLEGLERP